MRVVDGAHFDWWHVDTVLLDMDGTLLDLRFDNFFWREFVPLRFSEAHGIGPNLNGVFLRVQVALAGGRTSREVRDGQTGIEDDDTVDNSLFRTTKAADENRIFAKLDDVVRRGPGWAILKLL